MPFNIKMVAYAINLLLLDIIRHILLTVNKRVNHATQGNKWSVCYSFFLTTYLLNLEVDFFNKLSAFLWEHTVRLYWPTSYYFHVNPSDTCQKQEDQRNQIIRFHFQIY